MQKSEVKPLLESMGAIVDGHFEYRSGLHGSKYVNKDMLYTNPHATRDVCELIAEEICMQSRDLGLSTEEEFAVVAPAVGGVALSQWTVSHLLNRGMKVIALYADKNNDIEAPFVIKRGYENLIPGKKVVVVEDILTKGDFARNTVKAVKVAGGDVVMAVAVVNRGLVTADKLSLPNLTSLLEINLATYEPLKCPLCAQGIPMSTSLGHGAKKA